MATITIDLGATPSWVWSILIAGQEYPAWNPFIRELDGSLTPGSKAHRAHPTPGRKAMTFAPKVTDVEPGHRLAWLGHVVPSRLPPRAAACRGTQLNARRVRGFTS
jgi:hypothetical protein